PPDRPQGAVHPAHRPRRPRARGQGGAGRRQQLPDQAVHRTDTAREDRAGDGEALVKAASAAQLAPGAAAAAARSAASADRPGEDVAAFLDTLTVILRETLGRLEGTVGRVSEMVLTRSGPADRELIVTLQDFDRLQQEFAALVDVISHCAATSGSWSGDSWT